MTNEKILYDYVGLCWHLDVRVGCVAVYKASEKLNCFSGDSRWAVYYRGGKYNEEKHCWEIDDKYVEEATDVYNTLQYELLAAKIGERGEWGSLYLWLKHKDGGQLDLFMGATVFHEKPSKDKVAIILEAIKAGVIGG